MHVQLRIKRVVVTKEHEFTALGVRAAHLLGRLLLFLIAPFLRLGEHKGAHIMIVAFRQPAFDHDALLARLETTLPYDIVGWSVASHGRSPATNASFLMAMRRNTSTVHRYSAVGLVYCIRDGLELHLSLIHVIGRSSKKVHIFAHVGNQGGTLHVSAKHSVVWSGRCWPLSRRARQVRTAFIFHTANAQYEITRLLQQEVVSTLLHIVLMKVAYR